jgi:hypothetical protein
MQGKQEKIFLGVSMGLFTLLAGVLLMTNMDSEVRAAGAKQVPAPGGQGWHLLDPVTYENLTIFPVVSTQQANTSDFSTLDEALASGDAVVTEQGDYLRRTREGAAQTIRPRVGAQVNQLVLVNRGKRPLILLAGEVVSGGKQDRIIGKDRIVPMGAPPLPLDVFCVERGRWTDGSDKFAAAKIMVHPSVREKAALEQDQSQVWAAVRGQASMSSRAEVESQAGRTALAPPISSGSLDRVIASAAPTESYKQIYESRAVGSSVENFAEQIQRRFDRATSGLKGERVVGVVVAFGGEVAWSDAFASSQLFEIYWPKLLRSYVIEALTRQATRENASLDDARDFLHQAATGHFREETEPGVYRWRESTSGKVAQIELEALAPKPMTLHWLKVLRAS